MVAPCVPEDLWPVGILKVTEGEHNIRRPKSVSKM